MAFVKPAHTVHSSHDERGRGRDLAGLIAQLSHVDATVRRWAARDLAEHPQSSEALVAQLGKETEYSVRALILASLARVADTCAVNGLATCLRSEDARLRNEAVEAMQSLPHAIAPLMSSLLSDADPDVRILAVNILESLRHPNVEQWLLDVIDRDTHVNVCATAVDLLGEVGTTKAHDALLRLKQRFLNEPYIQFATDLALKRIIDA